MALPTDPTALLDATLPPEQIWVVGALITDGTGRVYAHRRSLSRKLFPGCWDVVGGHVEADETLRQALVRELHEETGWQLGDILGCVKEFEWEADGGRRHEIDYLVTIVGDTDRPQLEDGKQDQFAWFDSQNLDVLLENREPGDTAIYDMAVSALELLSAPTA